MSKNIAKWGLFLTFLSLVLSLSSFAAEREWAGSEGALTYFPTQAGDFENAIEVSGCRLEVGMERTIDTFSVQKLSGQCTNQQLIFTISLPTLVYAIGDDGWLFNEHGLAGRVTGDSGDFEYTDAQEGVHRVHFDLLEGGASSLRVDWQYEGNLAPSFRISGGLLGI